MNDFVTRVLNGAQIFSLYPSTSDPEDITQMHFSSTIPGTGDESSVLESLEQPGFEAASCKRGVEDQL